MLASVFIWKSCLRVIPKVNFLILFYLSYLIYHYQSQANLYRLYESSLENFSVLVKSGSCYSPYEPMGMRIVNNSDPNQKGEKFN